MELEGVVHNGVIVPVDATALPEGMRVRIEPVPPKAVDDLPTKFAGRFAAFKGCLPPDVPEDLSTQHEHYRLGIPRR